MKLAFCLFKYFPYGGLQRDFLRIARLCIQRGHEVHVYTMSWEGELEPGLYLHVIKARGWQNHTRVQAFVKKLHAEFAMRFYDLVIGFNKMPHLDVYYAADVCYQARAKEQHGLLYRLLPRYRQMVALERAVFARGLQTELLLIAPAQQQAFMHYYQAEAERFHLLPPGIAKDRIAPDNALTIRESVRKANHILPEQLLLLMVGSGFKTKGLDRAIRSLAALPQALRERCQLFVIGQDNAKTFIALAKQLGVAAQLQFLGGRPDVPHFLLAADVLLHPAYHENTGTVLLEALVAGLPVLTVESCGYAHYIEAAKAGIVLRVPFQQTAFNAELEHMLLSLSHNAWRQNGLAFARNTDLYSLPEKVVTHIEAFAAKKMTAVNRLTFEQMMSLRGESFRQQKGRLTQRITLGEKRYFIKQHTGVGWKEMIKNALQLRWPVLTARNEKQAIDKLRSLGVAVPIIVAYGERGLNPARRQSFILMDELAPVISLEDLCKTWQQTSPSFALKNRLIAEVARIARTMHESGVNHKDFYICHFLLDTSPGIDNINGTNLKLYLIDLHRAITRRITPERWIIKDLAGLYFSSKNSGLTRRDLYRFIKAYKQQSLRHLIKTDVAFWEKVKLRGEQLYDDHA